MLDDARRSEAGAPRRVAHRRRITNAAAPRRRTVRLLATAASVGLGLAGTAARADGFVADLSDHLIAITTAFTGSHVLLFGALEGPPGSREVSVVVRGPAGEAGVRRKRQVGPVWVFTDEVRFRDVPAYYAVAASRPLAELAEPAELARHGVGVDSLRLEPVDPAGLDEADLAASRAALVRGKQRQRLYPEEVGTVSFLGGALFRTRLAFPANVPPGTYEIEVLQFADGRVAHAQSSVLDISKICLEADLYDFAHRQPALYASAAIVAAVAAGWAASVAFRRA